MILLLVEIGCQSDADPPVKNPRLSEHAPRSLILAGGNLRVWSSRLEWAWSWLSPSVQVVGPGIRCLVALGMASEENRNIVDWERGSNLRSGRRGMYHVPCPFPSLLNASSKTLGHET